MAFKTAIMVMAPDGDPNVHRASIKTSKLEYTLVVVQAGNIDQAVDVCQALVKNDGIQSFFLCPGFTYGAVARVKKAVGAKISVNVVKGDMQDTVISARLLAQEGIRIHPDY
jgi:hypothetical protein